MLSGRIEATTGSWASIPLTMSRVEELPFLKMDTRTPRTPFCRTTLICGAKPSRTCATSDR